MIIGNIFKKYNKIAQKKRIITTIIESLNIKDAQKKLYLESLEFLDEVWLEKLYKNLWIFIKEIEQKQVAKISEQNFWVIAGMRKKEAKEKIKDLNNLWFLLSNI